MSITYRELKALLDKVPDEQLDQRVPYNSEANYMSGVIEDFKLATEDLIWDGGDDPATLYTEADLKERGFDDEEIFYMDVQIDKGQYYITF